MSDWTQEPPTDPGIYIYTGWTRQRFSPPHFVRVMKVGNHVLYDLNGYVLTEKERTPEGWWLRVPDPPAGAMVNPLKGEE